MNDFIRLICLRTGFYGKLSLWKFQNKSPFWLDEGAGEEINGEQFSRCRRRPFNREAVKNSPAGSGVIMIIHQSDCAGIFFGYNHAPCIKSSKA
ncbi:MAG TPA: hypothetical protein VIK53_03835 [Verrucomicrobiae bacterium]